MIDWTPAQLEAYARNAAALLRIDIDEHEWASVLSNLESMAAVAATLLAEPLPDDLAVSPVFEA